MLWFVKVWLEAQTEKLELELLMLLLVHDSLSSFE